MSKESSEAAPQLAQPASLARDRRTLSWDQPLSHGAAPLTVSIVYAKRTENERRGSHRHPETPVKLDSQDGLIAAILSTRLRAKTVLNCDQSQSPLVLTMSET
ncbi:hypothetical protein V6N13_082559 [Hibiscus sabdariffa]|uniref:Uncharacterized protein n=1 Tax=Hibiscus sabdariffa TaxID=183260 RepID=A0ABR2Q3R1_9ROSI